MLVNEGNKARVTTRQVQCRITKYDAGSHVRKVGLPPLILMASVFNSSNKSGGKPTFRTCDSAL